MNLERWTIDFLGWIGVFFLYFILFLGCFSICEANDEVQSFPSDDVLSQSFESVNFSPTILSFPDDLESQILRDPPPGTGDGEKPMGGDEDIAVGEDGIIMLLCGLFCYTLFLFKHEYTIKHK